jgi:hypothetical protein
MYGMIAILGAVLALVNLTKKVPEKTDLPFWEQLSLSGSRAIEWLSTKNGPMKLEIEELHFGELKYFFKDFDFANALQFKEKLELESTIMMLKCKNLDRMVMIDQKGAIKMLMKVLFVEDNNKNIGASFDSKIFIDADGNTGVHTVEFIKIVEVTFALRKDGKFSHYIIEELE